MATDSKQESHLTATLDTISTMGDDIESKVCFICFRCIAIGAECLEKRFVSTQTDMPPESKNGSTQTDISDGMDEPTVCNIAQQPDRAVNYPSAYPCLPGTTSLDSVDYMSRSEDKKHEQSSGEKLAADFTDMTEVSSYFVLRQMSAVDHMDIVSKCPDRSTPCTIGAAALLSTALVLDSASNSPLGHGHEISSTSAQDSSSKTLTRTVSSCTVSEHSELATASTVTPMILDKAVVSNSASIGEYEGGDLRPKTFDQNLMSETGTMNDNEVVRTQLAFSSSHPKMIVCKRGSRAKESCSSFDIPDSMSVTGMQDRCRILGLQPNSFEDTKSIGAMVNDSELENYNQPLPVSQFRDIQQNLHKHRDDTSSFVKSICRPKCSLPDNDNDHWSMEVDGTSEENTSVTRIKEEDTAMLLLQLAKPASPTKGQKRYPCRTCGMTFVSKKFMKVHTRLHGDTDPFFCELCQIGFVKKHHLVSHMELNHSDNQSDESESHLTDSLDKTDTIPKRYPCRICGMTFASKKFMKVHIQLHGDTDPFFCELCQTGFMKKHHLVTHMELDHSVKQSDEPESHLRDSLDTPDKISKSGRKNITKPAIRIVDNLGRMSKSSTRTSGKVSKKHTKSSGDKHTKSSGDSSGWVCRKCGFSYQTKHAFDKHEKLHSDFDPYKCGVCERGFILLHHLDKHSESHPPEDRMKCFIYAGTVCSRVLKAEVPDVPVSDTGNTHQCDTCHKFYSSKTRLSAHIRLMHKDRLVCHYCGRAFNLKKRLLDHLHDHAEVKPYACAVCSRTFSTAYTMKCHMSIHREAKLFPCPTCQKAFKSARLLYRHSLMHKRPHMCDVCGKTFSRKSFLDDHVSTVHTKVKAHTCAVCEKAFSWKDNLLAHMKRLHKP